MLSEERQADIKSRFQEITESMSQPDVATDPEKMAELGREHAQLRPIVDAIDEFAKLRADLAGLVEMAEAEDDEEMTAMVQDEIQGIEERLPGLEADLQVLLLPRDPLDAKSAIVEIRAGTGGDEAGLFAGDLFRMYSRYGEARGWRTDVMSSSPGSQGGFKEIVFSVEGDEVFGTLKYESGVHRVQRVPATESSGRIHTSAATVAVLPEAEDVEVDIRNEDIEIDVYRSSGPGGQSVNTTDSAVRITHLPTGLVVTCQDEKSQHKNRDKAMRVLRARLFEQEQARLNAERSQARKGMVGSGDRSAKIRTYNWPQGRVTDHRLEGDDKNHALQGVIGGDLEGLHRALKIAENAERLSG